MAAALAAMGRIGWLRGLIGLPESASSTEIMLLLNSNILRENYQRLYLDAGFIQRSMMQRKKLEKRGRIQP